MPCPLLGQPLHALEKQDLTVLYEESLEGGAKDAVELYQGVKSDVEKKLGLEVTFIPSILLIKNTERFQKMAGSGLVVAFAVPEKRLMVIDHSRVSASPFSLAVTMKHELSPLLVHY